MSTNRTAPVSGSNRGERLVVAWNAGDRAYVLDQLAEDVVLEARLPKVPAPAPALIVTGKRAFVEGMAKLPGRLPRFVVVSALENNGTVSLVLEDEDRHLLVVGIDLDEDGLFSRITSFRPDR